RRRERLTESVQGSPPVAAPDKAFLFDGKSVLFARVGVAVRGLGFPVTLMEGNLVPDLVQRGGKTGAPQAVLEGGRRRRVATDPRAIDNFIVRLRRYLETDPTRPRHLLTVRGVGYRFVAEPGVE